MNAFDRLDPEARERYEEAQAEVAALKQPSTALYECGTPVQINALFNAYADFQKAAQVCLGTEAAKILEALRQVSEEETK